MITSKKRKKYFIFRVETFFLQVISEEYIRNVKFYLFKKNSVIYGAYFLKIYLELKKIKTISNYFEMF